MSSTTSGYNQYNHPYNTDGYNNYDYYNYNYCTGTDSNAQTQYGTNIEFNTLEQGWNGLVPEDLTQYNQTFARQQNKTLKDYREVLYVNMVANQNLNEMLQNKLTECDKLLTEVRRLQNEIKIMQQNMQQYKDEVKLRGGKLEKWCNDLIKEHGKLVQEFEKTKQECNKYKDQYKIYKQLEEESMDEHIPDLYKRNEGLQNSKLINNVYAFDAKRSKFLKK